MRESVGKAKSREMLYRACLPSWLAPDEIPSAYYLTLLGNPARELEFTDALGIPRNQIWSVERAHDVYGAQQETGLGVSLYRGEMADFLRSSIHLENRIQVLNLDIEGSYREQLDPAMTSVLVFCMKNAETVVGTYSSIGRDRSTLLEGLLSLGVLLSIDEAGTEKLLRTMARRYELADYTEPVLMVLRDLFWLRSILEHTLAAGRLLGTIPDGVVKDFLERKARIWADIRDCGTPLKLSEMKAVAARTQFRPASFSLELAEIFHMIYRAQPPWSQRAYFMKVELVTSPVSLREWYWRAIGKFLASPLFYIDRLGSERAISEWDDGTDDLVVWKDGLPGSWKPRKLKLEPSSAHWQRAVVSLREKILLARASKEIPVRPARKEVHVAKKKAPGRSTVQFMRGGELTETGREIIRSMAKKGMSVEDIRSEIPASVPVGSIRAHVAIAHRKA